ncbi:hypothetical protein B0H17DRAFT_1332056 [Mycena rosella]|uniref:Uncharacterized protein n=1 Tax=Mycena rosella TaxID=1033263 RepID=A0AAD7DCT8_MYCRO|nr:hypothetical protein B0H17DRAFT_1332056 [Mycena rosella]
MVGCVHVVARVCGTHGRRRYFCRRSRRFPGLEIGGAVFVRVSVGDYSSPEVNRGMRGRRCLRLWGAGRISRRRCFLWGRAYFFSGTQLGGEGETGGVADARVGMLECVRVVIGVVADICVYVEWMAGQACIVRLLVLLMRPTIYVVLRWFSHVVCLRRTLHSPRRRGTFVSSRRSMARTLCSMGRAMHKHHPHAPSTPSFPPRTPAAHAEHARLLSWFLDARATPFGVHRMAFAGKTLIDAFHACGLGVSVATDGTLYQTEVFAASHSPASVAGLHAAHAHSSTAHSHSSSATPARSPGSSAGHSTHSKGLGKPETKVWGDRPVLLLLGIRLGLDGVNPV